VRFTGGEPLLRPGLEKIISAAAELDPQPELSLTTNGIGLDPRAAALVDSGLARINVSLDTLQPDRFRQLARRDRLPDVLAGLHAAARAGLRPVKVNAVLMRGINDDEAPDLLRFCIDNGFDLRFIEQMPLDADHSWRRDEMITAEEILAALGEQFGLTPSCEPRGSAPAERWLVDGGPATVGVIGSVSRPFCAACARTRLTADGQIRNCLFSAGETDLRSLLRNGADDLALAERWRQAMWGKAAGHGIDTPAFLAASRSMSAIGG
jgi:cyclic pyranopterin phosphate synthase